MKTRRSSTAAVLDFTASEGEEEERESEDAMRRNVEKERDERVKWKREKEGIQGKGIEGGATIKPNGLKLFAPRPSAHNHPHSLTHIRTHTHTHSLPQGAMAHVCSQADRQEEINRALGPVCVCVCQQCVRDMLVVAYAMQAEVQC